MLARAETPPFRERYLRAFCLDLEGSSAAAAAGDGPAPNSPPPSPPPSPPSSTGATALAVGAFVWLETYKAVLLRKVWMLGLLCAAASIALLGLGLVAWSAPATDAAAAATTIKVVYAVSTATQLVASLVGWWTCQNKKDDLNTMRSLAEMQRLVQRLEIAESHLRGALDAMLVSGAEIDTLDVEIEEAFSRAQAQLDQIRAEQQRRREGRKAHTLNNVLLKFVNMDDRPYWYAVRLTSLGHVAPFSPCCSLMARGRYDRNELNKLYQMIRAMTGEPAATRELELHGHLKRVLMPTKIVAGEAYLASAVKPIMADQLPGNEVLDYLVDYKAFEMIMSLPLDEEHEGEGGEEGEPKGGGAAGRAHAANPLPPAEVQVIIDQA